MSASATTGPTPETPSTGPAGWIHVCGVDDVLVDTGVCVLAGDVQVAVFRLADGHVFAVGNVDPVSGRSVLSRGIVGDRAGAPTVSSPLYGDTFDLRTGAGVDDTDLTIPTYPVRVVAGRIEIVAP